MLLWDLDLARGRTYTFSLARSCTTQAYSDSCLGGDSFVSSKRLYLLMPNSSSSRAISYTSSKSLFASRVGSDRTLISTPWWPKYCSTHTSSWDAHHQEHNDSRLSVEAKTTSSHTRYWVSLWKYIELVDMLSVSYLEVTWTRSSHSLCGHHACDICFRRWQ